MSFDSCIATTEGCVVLIRCFEFLHGAPYAVCVELKNFYLFVFCFGGLLFVPCVGSWGGCCWGGGRRNEVCVLGICGESRDV